MILAGKEVPKINVTALEELLYSEKNILILGPSGWGKSKTIINYAKKVGKKLKIISLASKLPEAIGGIPSVTDDKQYYIELLSEELREVFEDGGEGWIIFFDEINQAVAEVLNTLYGICYPFGEDRVWAGHSLAKAQIVAAGNLTDGRDGVTYLTALPDPLIKRFHPFELEPSKLDALNYLKEKWSNIHKVEVFIEAMLEDDKVAPRDIEECLDTIANKKHPLLLHAKLGPALGMKIQQLMKEYAPKDPAKALKNCREAYEQFKRYGKMQGPDGTIIVEEKEVLAIFKDRMGLSDEELAGIVKGAEENG